MPQLHGMYRLNKSLKELEECKKTSDSLDSPKCDRPVTKDHGNVGAFTTTEKHIDCVKAGGIF